MTLKIKSTVDLEDLFKLTRTQKNYKKDIKNIHKKHE